MRHMKLSGDTSSTGRTTGHKYSIPDAAALLNLTEEAVRQRVKRGTLDSVKVGRNLFVMLDLHRHVTDQSQHVNDRTDDVSQLVLRLEDEVTFLRGELKTRAEELAEMRRIVAALTSRIPELPAASPQRSPESGESNTTVNGDQASEPKTGSWWRRVFG